MSNTILAEFPIDLDKVKGEELNREILRAGLIAELDAISFYEQMAEETDDEDIRAVLLDVERKKKSTWVSLKPSF